MSPEPLKQFFIEKELSLVFLHITWYFLKCLEDWNEALLHFWDILTQPAFACSKPTMETPEKCVKITRKTAEWCQWLRSGVFIVNFKQISHNFSGVSIVDFEQLNAGWELFPSHCNVRWETVEPRIFSLIWAGDQCVKM